MNPVVFSSLTDEYRTPSHIYAALDYEFHFTLDPCPIGGTDGLEIPWSGSVFVNPPYSNIAPFIEKAWRELKAGNVHTVVFLVPSRTDMGWFHDYCLKAHEIRFLRGRLKFVGGKSHNAPFPSMVVVFK